MFMCVRFNNCLKIVYYIIFSNYFFTHWISYKVWLDQQSIKAANWAWKFAGWLRSYEHQFFGGLNVGNWKHFWEYFKDIILVSREI